MGGIRTAIQIDESGEVLDQIDELASPSTSRAIALAVLTSPDIMINIFQARLPSIYSDAVTVRQCHSRVLKQRLGSTQVIAYTLRLSSSRRRLANSLELVGKRYANRAQGERAFRTMQRLWQGGFGEGSRLTIPRPVGYFSDLKLLIQERAVGTLLPAYLRRRDPAALAHIRMAARWLVRLHRLEWCPEERNALQDDGASVTIFAARLGERYPLLALRMQELAGAIRRETSLADATLSMVHGDFHPENIFVTGRGATVIDFDHFCRSDPASDVGYIVAQMRSMACRATGSLNAADSAIRIFLEAYLGALSRDRRDRLAARIPAFVARAFLQAMYYVLCVMDDTRPDVLSMWPNEIDRFIRARTVAEVIG